MGANTAIPWARHSWNPWHGCHRVSPGCRHCYMMDRKKDLKQDGNIVVRSTRQTFNAPLRWKEPATIFVCSWSDFFIEEADPWRDDAWGVMFQAPQHNFLLLTKRPERIFIGPSRIHGSNIWYGCTVEHQQYYNRADDLPMSNSFISAEPLLGELTLSRAYAVQWVIAGCEKIKGRPGRTAHIDWFRSLRDQCQAFGIPFFLKQMEVNGRVVEMPELDGVVWDQVPEGLKL